MKQKLLARARAMCLAAGGSPAMCDEAAAMALAMKKCLASGRSVEDCKAEAIKACMAKGHVEAAVHAGSRGMQHRRHSRRCSRSFWHSARAKCLAAGGSAKDVCRGSSNGAAMKKCLASGKSVEECKAEAIKACMAKGMSKEECTKAAEVCSTGGTGGTAEGALAACEGEVPCSWWVGEGVCRGSSNGSSNEEVPCIGEVC